MSGAPISSPFVVARLDDDDLRGPNGLALCDPGYSVLAKGPLTFSPPKNSNAFPEAWLSWQEKIFAPLLGAFLLSAHAHATAGRVRELATLSAELHEQLPRVTSARLQQAGRALLAHLTPARAAMWPARLSKLDEQGKPAACFPVIFAARCALFHLPLRSMLLGYAACEWHASTSAPRRGNSIVDCADEITTALAEVPARVEKMLGQRDFSTQAAQQQPG